MRERHDDDCLYPMEDNHLAGPSCPTKPKRKRKPPRQISVTGETYAKIAAHAKARGVPVSEVVGAIIAKALDDKGVPR